MLQFFQSELCEVGPIPGVPVVIDYAPHFRYDCAIIRDDFDNEDPWLIQTPKSEIDFTNEQMVFGNAAAIRDALELIANPEEASAFLEKCGPWLPPPTISSEETDIQRFTWKEFRLWQSHFRSRRLGEDGHLRMDYLSPRFSSKVDNIKAEIKSWGPGGRSQLTAWMACTCAVEAVSAVIELDRLQGVKYRVCAFEGCQKVFRLGFKKEKICCDDSCSHAHGQRRRRAQARLQRQKSTEEAA
jgi:hypothetical protein